MRRQSNRELCNSPQFSLTYEEEDDDPLGFNGFLFIECGDMLFRSHIFVKDLSRRMAFCFAAALYCSRLSVGELKLTSWKGGTLSRMIGTSFK